MDLRHACCISRTVLESSAVLYVEVVCEDVRMYNFLQLLTHHYSCTNGTSCLYRSVCPECVCAAGMCFPVAHDVSDRLCTVHQPLQVMPKRL